MNLIIRTKRESLDEKEKGDVVEIHSNTKKPISLIALSFQKTVCSGLAIFSIPVLL